MGVPVIPDMEVYIVFRGLNKLKTDSVPVMEINLLIYAKNIESNVLYGVCFNSVLVFAAMMLTSSRAFVIKLS